MKTLDRDALVELPNEIKGLVQDGVYSLYKIAHAQAEYLLVTKGSEYYLLSATGAWLRQAPPVSSVRDVQLVDAVSFSCGDTTVRINVG